MKSSLGNELTATDVVWSMEKAFAGKATTAFILAFIGGVTSADAVRAIDASTVEFSLAVPEERILLALGWGWPVVYDSSEVRRHATADDPYANEWLHTHAAGFGPYALAAYSQAGREVVLEAHSSYWGPPPAVGRVTLRTIDDSSERLRLLLDGTVHYAPDLTPVELDAVERSERAHIVHIDGTPGAFISLAIVPPVVGGTGVTVGAQRRPPLRSSQHRNGRVKSVVQRRDPHRRRRSIEAAAAVSPSR